MLHAYRNDGADAAVVFIHGFGGKAVGTWGEFPELLATEPRLNGWDIYNFGYSTGLAPDILRRIWSSDPDLDELAVFLSTNAATGDLGGYGALVLIAHSMGGLVTQRALLNDQELSGRVRHVFLFGTPSGGLAKAAMGRKWKAQLDNMAKGGEFVTRLRSEWDDNFDKSTFCLWVVAGDKDEFVPDDSSLDPFPTFDGDNDCTPETRVQKRIVSGNHLEIVKPSKGSLPAAIVIEGIAGGKTTGGVNNAARVAVAQGKFQEAIDRFGDHPQDLDQEALVDLALAYDEMKQPDKALETLELHGKSNDAKGTLGGRYKRRWLFDRRQSDAEHALELYTTAYESAAAEPNHEDAYYLGINVAFMHLAFTKDKAKTAEMATKAMEHAGHADAGMWRSATEGEANLYLGNFDAALESYKAALAADPQPRQVESMYAQAGAIAERLGDAQLEANIEALFRGD